MAKAVTPVLKPIGHEFDSPMYHEAVGQFDRVARLMGLGIEAELVETREAELPTAA